MRGWLWISAGWLVLAGCNREGGAEKVAPPTASAPAPTPAAEGEAAPAPEEKPPADVTWSYSGETGPDQWGALQPEFGKCGSGQAQSPVDLPDAKSGGKTPGPISVDYKPAPLAVQFDGHVIGFESSSESSILVDGQRYFLVRGELHSPAEHRVGGKALDMELELYHRNESDEWLVVSVLFAKGEESSVLKPVFDYLPVKASGTVDIVKGVELDLTSLVPSDFAYRYYDGSLTRPPCSEGVRWVVLNKTASVSENQIRRYAGVVGGDTHRPLQPVNDRKVGVFGR